MKIEVVGEREFQLEGKFRNGKIKCDVVVIVMNGIYEIN